MVLDKNWVLGIILSIGYFFLLLGIGSWYWVLVLVLAILFWYWVLVLGIGDCFCHWGLVLGIGDSASDITSDICIVPPCLLPAHCFPLFSDHCFQIIVRHIRLIHRFHCLHFDWRNFNELYIQEIKIKKLSCTFKKLRYL